MKKPISLMILALSSVSPLSAAVTITVSNNVPNGVNSGGSGSGFGVLNSSVGSVTSDRGMPVTIYSLTGVDLTAVGAGASESFSFSVTYTATTDGSTPGIPRFNGFGNVSVEGGDNNQVDGSETLMATIALVSSSYPDLLLGGFTLARAGGVGAGEAGTFTWEGGGIHNITSGGGIIANGVTGNSFTLAVSSGTMNIEGFAAEFIAIPEPASASFLVVLSGIALLRRRRAA